MTPAQRPPSSARPLRSAVDGVRHTAHDQQLAYAGDQDRPLGGYLGAMTLYAAVVGAVVLAARASDREIPEPTLRDVLLLGAATHKLSRLVAKDPVTSPLRAPFTRFAGRSGDAEVTEETRGSGARHAVGELPTCPFCVGQWVATGFAAGLVFAPRLTRLVAGTVSAIGLADLLQFGYSAAERAAA